MMIMTKSTITTIMVIIMILICFFQKRAKKITKIFAHASYRRMFLHAFESTHMGFFFSMHIVLKSLPYSIFMDISVFCLRVTFLNWPLATQRASQEHPGAGSKWCHASRWPPTPQKLASFIIAIAQGQCIGKHGHYGSWGDLVSHWQGYYHGRRSARRLLCL